MSLLQFGIPALWTIIMLIAYLIVKNDKKFPVTYFSNVGYKVDCSPALSWSKTTGLSILLGFVFLIIMWVAFAVSIFGWVNFPSNSSGATYLVLIPAACSISFFLAGYSSRLVSNFVQVEKGTFESWIRSGDIEKRGENKYIDTSDRKVLLHAFDNKAWIR